MKQKEENRGNCDRFFEDFCGVLSGMIIRWILQTKSGSGILLQRGIAILDREAAALPGRFLPELGRSLGSGLFSFRLAKHGLAALLGRLAGGAPPQQSRVYGHQAR